MDNNGDIRRTNEINNRDTNHDSIDNNSCRNTLLFHILYGGMKKRSSVMMCRLIGGDAVCGAKSKRYAEKMEN
jgi:hypothetical protein